MMKDRNEMVTQLNEKFTKAGPIDILKHIELEFGKRAAFSSSLGAEDQVILQMISKYAPSIRVFTIDTGRLFPETYELLEKSCERFKTKIEVYFPEYGQVEQMVNEKGINLFYNSLENRKLCCHVRKKEPLKRALQNTEIWITGIRKDQSVTRFFNQYAGWDNENQIIKVNPLLDWNEKNLWDYIQKNNIPYNPLHDKGFSSIGCQPCTRALKKGEDIRAGRWWWEQPEHKECGLHNQ